MSPFNSNITYVEQENLYAEGTVDAIFFLFTQLMDEKKNSNSKKIFNMIDVLKSGGMR